VKRTSVLKGADMLSQSRVNSLVAGLVVAFVTSSALAQCGAKDIEKSAVKKVVKIVMGGEEGCSGVTAKSAALEEPCCPGCSPGCCPECPIGCCSEAAGGEAGEKMIKVMIAGEDWCPGASAKAAALKEPCCPECAPGCCAECPIGCCSKAAGGEAGEKMIKVMIGGEDWCPGASTEEVIIGEPCCPKAAGGKVIKKMIKKVLGAGERCCPGASTEEVIVKKHRRLKSPAGHCGCGGGCAGRSHKHGQKHDLKHGHKDWHKHGQKYEHKHKHE